MMHRRAGARTERQVLAHAIVLRQIDRHLVQLRGESRTDGRIANRQTADTRCGCEISFEQRRRERQRARAVVETVARIVGGKNRLSVDVERKQIANRVGVFRSIQAMNRNAAWIRVEPGGAIQLRLEG